MVQFDCGCTFRGIGNPPDNRTCRPHETLKDKGYDKHIHPHNRSGCDECGCHDYRPRAEPANKRWPGCVCGHSAEGHNQIGEIGDSYFLDSNVEEVNTITDKPPEAH